MGLSRSKTVYVKAVAEAAGPNYENFDNLHKITDDEVLKLLTDIKGIGLWSAQMFLMFQLQRPDFFVPGDLGLKKAISLLYGISMDNPEKAWID